MRLLKINRFNIGEHCEHGPLVAGQAQEVYTLGEHCNRCQRGTCGAAPGQEIFHCPQLSQRRMDLNGDFTACQPQSHAAPLPVAA